MKSSAQFKTGRGPCPINGSPRWSFIGELHFPELIVSYGNPKWEPGLEWVYIGEATSGGAKYIRRQMEDEGFESESIQTFPIESIPVKTPKKADTSLRHRVYRTLIEHCPLNSSHRSHLARRQLDFKALKAHFQFGSMPHPRRRPKLASQLMKELGLSKEEILTVPGFFINDKKHLSIGGAVGILIPSYDSKGRIQALQIRKNKADVDESRYTWLSSSNKRGGIGSGAPACFLGDRNAETVWVTEGSFKAAALLINDWAEAVISVAGVGNIQSVLEILETLDQVKQVIVVYDSDWNQNAQVLKSLARLLQAAKGSGLGVQAMGWHPTWGKGIDDAIAAHMEKSHLFEIPTEGILRASKPLHYSNPRLKSTSDLPTWNPENKQVLSIDELRQETFQMVFDALNQKAGTFTSGAANTGSGKTYASIQNALPQTIQMYRNYQTLEEAEVQMRQKHGVGKVRVLYGRVGPPQDERDLAAAKRFKRAGCLRFAEMKSRSERGHSPCEGCPLRPQHLQKETTPGAAEKNEESELCPYWTQRLKTLQEPPDYLLLVPQSFASNPDLLKMLPDGETKDLFDEEFIRLIIDDCPEFYHHLARQRQVSLSDLNQWKAHPALTEATEENQLLTRWINELLVLMTSNMAQPPIPSSLRSLSKAVSALKEPCCETPIEGETLPLKAVNALSSWLCQGGSLHLEGEDKKTQIRFLQPATQLIKRLKHMTLLNLDATPDEPLLKWFSHLMDMRFEAPEMKRRFPRIVQVPEVLWDREQVKKQKPLIHALTEHIHDHQGIVLGFKNKDGEEEDHIALDGHFGLSERGLDYYNGAPMIGLLGHYALPITELESQVWELRELSKVMDKPSPDCFTPGVFDSTRHYNDPWRPLSREMHVSEDPLVEHIRRHQHTAAIVQGAARPRNFEATVLVLSGEPLDGLPWKVPVEIWNRQELNAHLELGLSSVEIFGDEKQISEALKAQNEQMREEALERFTQKLPAVRQYTVSLGRLPTIRELRNFLAEDRGMVSQKWAYFIRDLLIAEKRNQESENSVDIKAFEAVAERIESSVPCNELKNLVNLRAWSGTSDSNEPNEPQTPEKEKLNPKGGVFSETLSSNRRPVETDDFVLDEEPRYLSPPGFIPLSSNELSQIPPLAKVRLGLAEFGKHNGWNDELVRQISDYHEVAKELLYRFIGLIPRGEPIPSG